MTTHLSTKGQVIIPLGIREQDNLKPGDDFSIIRLGPGDYRLIKVANDLPKSKLVRPKKGMPYFEAPKRAPQITSEMVNELEAETL